MISMLKIWALLFSMSASPYAGVFGDYVSEYGARLIKLVVVKCVSIIRIDCYYVILPLLGVMSSI